jgi:hypothetical protein
MEVLSHAQSLLVEHAFTIGIGLLIAALIAGLAWYWMSRGSTKSDVLKNQARVNEANLEPSLPMNGPSPQPSTMTQDQVETENANIPAQMPNEEAANASE